MANARVSIWREEFATEDHPSDRATPPPSGPARTTSADGRFAFPDVQPGSYRLAIEKKGFVEARTSIEVGDGDPGALSIRLAKGATLRGRILGLTPEELADVGISANGAYWKGARIGPGPSYSIVNLDGGPWHVTASVRGSGRKAYEMIRIQPGDTEVELDLEFPDGFTLTGVLERNGRPMAGATLLTLSPMRTATTDSEGRFRIEELPAGTYSIGVKIGDFSRHGVWRPLLEELELGSDREIRLELTAVDVSGTLRNRVDGQPIPGAELTLFSDDSEGFAPAGAHATARSDPLGEFLLYAIADGSWRLFIHKPGYAPVERRLELRGGLPGDEIEIEMTRAEGTSFEAILDSGGPPKLVLVQLFDPAGRRLDFGHYEPTWEGRVHVSIAPAGWWLLVQGFSGDVFEADTMLRLACSENFVGGRRFGGSAIVRLAVSETGDLGRVVLSPGGSLVVLIPELEGASEPARITLTGPDGRTYWGEHPSGPLAGQARMRAWKALRGLDVGLWSFTVTHPDGRTWSGSARISPHETTRISFPGDPREAAVP